MSEEEKIIALNSQSDTEENDEPTKEEELFNFSQFFEETLGENDLIKAIGVMLTLPEDKFSVLAPTVIENYNKSLNNPNERALMMSAIRAQGATVEEYTEAFENAIETIDKLDQYSDAKKDFLRQIMAGTLTVVSETEGISKRFIQIPIEKCDPRATFPEYAHLSDSGADVFAIEDVTIGPGETKLIHTGLKAAIPPGYELQVRPKSGRSLKSKLRVANTPGTIDAGYRDEICIIMENIEPPFKDISYDFNPDGTIKITSILHGSSYTISAGEKVAQLVLAEVPKAGFYQVTNVLAVENMDENRGGGFGSTGLN